MPSHSKCKRTEIIDEEEDFKENDAEEIEEETEQDAKKQTKKRLEEVIKKYGTENVKGIMDGVILYENGVVHCGHPSCKFTGSAILFVNALKKISKSFLLQVPVQNHSNEHLYIGLSDGLNFLILFD